MASISNFTIGNKYNFTTYPSVLGTFSEVTVEGFVNHKAAGLYIDVPAMHANVFGSIPAGLCPNDVRQYDFMVLSHPNGTQTAIGLPWINDASIEEVQSKRCIISIENESQDRAMVLRDALLAVGARVSDIRFE